MTDGGLLVLDPQNPNGAWRQADEAWHPDIVFGDGLFETIGVTRGRPRALLAHLDRFLSSAAALDLVPPERSVLESGVLLAARAVAEHDEGAVRLVQVHAGGTELLTWITFGPYRAGRAARFEGLAVAVLDRGIPAHPAPATGWLPSGVKAAAYAVNRQAVREARRREADDAVFVSSDGVVLEGATASVLVRVGDRLLTPSVELPILPGITRRRVLAAAAGWGYDAAEGELAPADLHAADGLWLLSSLRLAAPVHTVDGRSRPVDTALSARLNALLLGEDAAV